MKCSWLILFLTSIALAHAQTQDMIDFRQKTLEKFNGARRLLASGDLRKLLTPVEQTIGVAKFKAANIYLDIMGPGADMQKLKWSRKLEQIGYEYTKEKVQSKDPLKSINYKDHVGFVWTGDVGALLDTAVKVIPINQLKAALGKELKLLETLIIAIWMGVAAPKTTPIKKGDTFGPAEVLYADRYEVGCYSNLLPSYCFLNKIDYRPELFKVGVSCSSCSTHCEFTRRKDGSAVEGELCVAPKGEVALSKSSEHRGNGVKILMATTLIALIMSF